jgi:hypothetical protein
MRPHDPISDRITVGSHHGIELTFGFRFDWPFAVPGLLLGIRPQTAHVSIDASNLEARFGPWRVDTPVTNIEGAEVTGPYWWPKVIGPAHLSLSDGGLTFATNAREGVCLRFKQPVRGIAPTDRFRHGSLTMTVDDCTAFAELIDDLIAEPEPTRHATDGSDPRATRE